MGTLFSLCGQFLFYHKVRMYSVYFIHNKYLKTTNITEFRRIYEIVFIEINKNHNHLNFNVLYSFHLKIVTLFSFIYVVI